MKKLKVMTLFESKRRTTEEALIMMNLFNKKKILRGFKDIVTQDNFTSRVASYYWVTVI